MKSKFIALFAIVAVFGLAIAAYAYTQTTVGDDKAKMSCCAKSDSCPMKAKDNAHKGEHDGKSCPMAKHGAAAHALAEGHTCCACCGDACPMKKTGASESTAPVSTEGDKNCCDNCDCCSGKTAGTAA